MPDQPKKIRVGILFGGCSAEHEVSLQSARNVYEALDKEKYEPVLIGIGKDGSWHLSDSSRLLQSGDPRLAKLNPSGLEENSNLALLPWKSDQQWLALDERRPISSLDVVFPVLHGPLGEDGTIQGLLRLAGLPFVGAGVLGSAVGMDKDVMKRLLRDAGIPSGRFQVLRRADAERTTAEELAGELGLPLFVKPANMGSSVGVHKVNRLDDLLPAIQDALRYDHKVLVEEFIEGREIECSVLGNQDPIASLPGEIIPQHDFYSYDAKYVDEDGALLKVPAQLPEEAIARIQQLAVQAFLVLSCEGMARVDVFLRPDGEVVVNEINTIPGFTHISMYPKLWEASGIPPSELIDRLIQLALERHQRDRQLKTSYADHC